VPWASHWRGAIIGVRAGRNTITALGTALELDDTRGKMSAWAGGTL